MGPGDVGTVRVSVDLELEPATAFDAVVEELAAGLRRAGLAFEAGPAGRVSHAGVEVGRVVSWEPGERAVLEWRAAPWQADGTTRVVLLVDALEAEHGSRVTVEHRGLGPLVGDAGELAGWFASAVAPPFLAAAGPAAFGDWLTDRLARRPSGARSRAIYRDPVYHWPNFRVILAELALEPSDELLEVGCGGGALLKEALAGGCRAAAIDHSPDMLRVARETNREAIAEGRLEILESSAERLPFADERFTCAVMTGVLGFLPDPVATLAEMRRVLRRGGRIVALGADPEMRGTPAAPEPMASRLSFYDDAELAELARAAGFADVRVERRRLEPFARAAGVPEEHLSLFAGPGPRFLFARKA